MVSMQIADVQDEIDHELITKAQIASKIHEVAAQVSKDYQGRDLLLVAVLKGAVNTIAAFSQALSIPVQVDFMSLSSYGSGTESSGTIAIRQDLSCDVRGRHILIVEDIVDSGRTLDVDVRYRGYEIPDESVVGFGLDYDERFRTLDSIAVLKPEVYQGE